MLRWLLVVVGLLSRVHVNGQDAPKQVTFRSHFSQDVLLFWRGKQIGGPLRAFGSLGMTTMTADVWDYRLASDPGTVLGEITIGEQNGKTYAMFPAEWFTKTTSATGSRSVALFSKAYRMKNPDATPPADLPSQQDFFDRVNTMLSSDDIERYSEVADGECAYM